MKKIMIAIIGAGFMLLSQGLSAKIIQGIYHPFFTKIIAVYSDSSLAPNYNNQCRTAYSFLHTNNQMIFVYHINTNDFHKSFTNVFVGGDKVILNNEGLPGYSFMSDQSNIPEHIMQAVLKLKDSGNRYQPSAFISLQSPGNDSRYQCIAEANHPYGM